jgi:hypothetical protein
MEYNLSELQELVNQFTSWQRNDEMAAISANLRAELFHLKFSTGRKTLTR